VQLNETELKIIRLVANGKTNAEVGKELGFSTRTVETYRALLMRNLGLKNFASLVKFAVRNNLTSLDESPS
jgi:DNA-binding NarL/FixJ family response regulator